MGPSLDEMAAAFAQRTERDGDIAPFITQAAGAGWCEHPVRLVGKSEHVDLETGELTGFDSATMPDGVLLRACRNRRASVCKPCAEIYRGDARMLVGSGLMGGKGVASSVASHPAVFLTLTAPSFGLVHRCPKSGNGPCRPGSPKAACPHGRATSCFARHAPDDTAVGEALCGDCYSYERQVIWNSLVTELWRRTTIALKRELARCAGMTEKEFSPLVTISYVKVVEYQARGAIHLHVVVRLDGPGGSGDAPPEFLSAVTLAEAALRAARSTSVVFPVTLGERVPPRARWGEVVDVTTVTNEKEARRVGAYAAKYTTKSTHDSGALDHRLVAADVANLENLGLRPHEAALVRSCWHLGGKKALSHLNLRRHAHEYGYGGNCLTHSRRYSTTFTALRAARHAHRRSEHPAIAEGKVLSGFAFAGRGYRTADDQIIARAFFTGRENSLRIAWEEAFANTDTG